jgi:hypothetical protein
LLVALEREDGLVRLVGVTSREGLYWIYTDKQLGRYVGGVRVGEGMRALRRLLYENLPMP